MSCGDGDKNAAAGEACDSSGGKTTRCGANCTAETCGDVSNRLDVTEGWNFLMRIYRAGKSVLEGAHELPAAKPGK